MCRHPKHDVGSVENVVRQYLREKAVLGTSSKQKVMKATADKDGS